MLGHEPTLVELSQLLGVTALNQVNGRPTQHDTPIFSTQSTNTQGDAIGEHSNPTALSNTNRLDTFQASTAEGECNETQQTEVPMNNSEEFQHVATNMETNIVATEALSQKGKQIVSEALKESQTVTSCLGGHQRQKRSTTRKKGRKRKSTDSTSLRKRRKEVR